MKNYDMIEGDEVSELWGIARREIEETGRISTKTYIELLDYDVDPVLIESIEEQILDELEDNAHYEEFYK